MFFIPAVQSALLQLTNESFVNVASVGTSVLMSCAISKPCRPSSVLTLFVLAPCPITWVFGN
jgi:hypothetical protein